MLPTLLLFLCAICVVVFVILYFGRKSGKKRAGAQERKIGRVHKLAPWPELTMPAALGVPEGHPARTAAERLELALDGHFESRVKDRVLRGETRLAAREWEWTWFELKRYFLMCGIVKGVPMYSSQADELWHEMLMFTREYEQFCERFCGAMIHHAPHTADGKPSADERAWFDWIYGELFLSSPVSGRIWGPFYRTPMSEARLGELASARNESVPGKWFNVKAMEKFGDLAAVVHYLMDRARSQLDAARRRERPESAAGGGFNPALSGVGMLSGMLIYHSVASPNAFASEMDRLQTEEQRKDNGGGTSASSCSSYEDDRSSDHGHHGDSGSDGGGDSGGSSCGSSCGGGCSS